MPNPGTYSTHHRSPRARHAGKVAVATALTSTAALTGCTVGLDALPAAAIGALIPFSACDEALDYLRTEAASRVGPFGLQGEGYGYDMLAGSPESVGTEDSAASAPAPADGARYSGTNNQEVGVDEADIVKTDGTHLFTVLDGTLRVTDVTDDSPDVIGELDLQPDTGGSADGPTDQVWSAGSAQLLLDGDRALVLMSQPNLWLDDMATERMPMPGYGSWNQSTIIAVDLSDPAQPRETARLSFDGDYLSSRLVDGTARVVVRSQPQLHFNQADGEPFLDPYADPDAALEHNRQVVAASTLDDWLPSYTLETPVGESGGQLVPCERVAHPEEFSGFATVSVLTVPLDDAAGLGEPAATAVLGDGETVYASTDRLYVVTNRWQSQQVGSGGDVLIPQQSGSTTGIHAFDITGSDVATHVASGQVPGHVIGQYALSEHEGVLRVATTDEDWSTPQGTSDSRVTTLEERDGELVALGSVDGLGEGEQIYAVRYVGDTAYVVTFRQTDPLYTIDLSDPANPRVAGELKITGYSAYLHPLDDDRLVGVGQEATKQGQTVGLQVSLFDTSDPAAPTKITGEVLRNTWSDAEWDSHAFLYWDATGQLMIPVSGDRGSGLLVLSVDGDEMINDGTIEASSGVRDAYMSPMRSLVVDDRVYTVWQDGVQVNDLASLTELGWGTFR